MKIKNRKIGVHEKTFIVAEAGINHNGDLKQAKELVKKAKIAGADAVKFQTFNAEKLSSRKNKYFKLFQSLELKKNEWIELKKVADRRGITFFSTPFDEESADFLDELNVPAFKIASGDLTHLPLLKHIGKKKKPIILSTGIGTIPEIDEALNTIYSTGNKEVALLHCISNYPAKIEDMNLRAIQTLRETFQVPVGLSDHTTEIITPIAAVSLGAAIIEKHFTLNKNLPGPDHRASLEPDEFKAMVGIIRSIEKALGGGMKVPRKSELKMKIDARRSLVSRVDIPQGARIMKNMVKVARPGSGIEPKFINVILGRKARRRIKAEEVIRWDMV